MGASRWLAAWAWVLKASASARNRAERCIVISSEGNTGERQDSRLLDYVTLKKLDAV